MKIRKVGHCCLVIEVNGKKILTDPGTFTTGQNEEKGVDLVLITHEHPDHFHIDSLKIVLQNNPNARVVTNSDTAKKLEEQGIKYEIVGDGEQTSLENILIEGMGKLHAEVYPGIPLCENTSYFINNQLFYPGDALYLPGRPVQLLALPVAGPWI